MPLRQTRHFTDVTCVIEQRSSQRHGGFSLSKLSFSVKYLLATATATAWAAGLFGATAALAQTITNSASLSFGAFAAGAGGTVVIAPQGLRSRTGSVMLFPQGVGTAAQFICSSLAGTSCTLVLPADGTVELTSGSNKMVVQAFSSNPPIDPSLLPLRIAKGTVKGGSQPFNIGATLVVNPAQAPGNYTGSFDVIVNFE